MYVLRIKNCKDNLPINDNFQRSDDFSKFNKFFDIYTLL